MNRCFITLYQKTECFWASRREQAGAIISRTHMPPCLRVCIWVHHGSSFLFHLSMSSYAFFAQSGHHPWLNRASVCSVIYFSIWFQYPLSSLIFLHEAHIGSIPLNCLT